MSSVYANKTIIQKGNFENTDSIIERDIKKPNDNHNLVTKDIKYFSNIETNDGTNKSIKVLPEMLDIDDNKQKLQVEKVITHINRIEKFNNGGPFMNFTEACQTTNVQGGQTRAQNNQDSISSSMSINYKEEAKTNSIIDDNLDVKNRCVDRYDSFESSDSGVGTSISCTESNAGVSEDTSERITPLNSNNAVNIDNDILLNTTINIVSGSQKIMSPQMLQESNLNICTNTSKGLNTTSSSNIKNHNVINDFHNKNPSGQNDDERQYGPTTLNNKNSSNLEWPWNTIVSNMSTTSSNVVAPKKRSASDLHDVKEHGHFKKIKKSGSAILGLTGDSGLCTINSVGISNSTNISKRLKAAALEESQTKITGYFKSQMKTQVTQNSGTVKQLPTVKSDSNIAKINNVNSVEPNSLALNVPATTASLNKYFNIFDHLKDTSNENGKLKGKRNNECDNSDVFTSSPRRTSTPKSNVPTSQMPCTISISPMAIPALKKIERAKPTKIAQVAPNLRKTPSTNSTFLNQNGMSGKSPLKKHVAIAPRTPEMKQQQAAAIKPNTARSLPQNITTQQMAVHLQSAAQQPTVLLTTFRIPTTQQMPAKESISTTNLSSASTQSRLNGADPAMINTNPSNATTVYQLPVQLPNLIQIPQILTTENPNIQFNNLGTDASVSKIATTATSTSEAQGAQTAASQYSCFLNGTIFKLQQFTTATTTTATSSSAVGAATSANPFNLLNPCDLQDFVIKQQQEQHQKASVTGTASFQEIFQQQIAAAIAANHQQGQQLQRISNQNNIQHPVVMATPAGLLLNTASLPTMLAQAAAVIAVNNQQQKAIAVPALQPIQQNQLPALSPIFTSQSQESEHMAQYAQQAQQQFITTNSMQPPPLSSVTLNNISQLQPLLQKQSQATTTKLTIIKAKSTSSSSSFPALSSQPPPLVTISNSKVRPKNVMPLKSVSPTPVATVPSPAIIQMPLTMSKTCQNRVSKIVNVDTKPMNAIENKLSHGKVGVTNGKIIATSTTPPPLIPRLLTSFKSIPAASKNSSLTNSNKILKDNKCSTKSNYVLKNGIVSNRNAKMENSNSKGASNFMKCELNECINESISLNLKHSPVEKEKEKVKRINENFDLLKNAKESFTDIISPGSALCQPLISFSNTLSSKLKEETVDEKLIDNHVTATIGSSLLLPLKEKSFCNLQNTGVKEELKSQIESDISEKLHPENSSSSFNSITNSICSTTDLLIENAISISRSSSETPSSINSQTDSSNSAGLPTISNDTSIAGDNIETSSKDESNSRLELTYNLSNSTESSDIHTSVESNTKGQDMEINNIQNHKKDDQLLQLSKCHSDGRIDKSDCPNKSKFSKFEICASSSLNKTAADISMSETRHLGSLISLSKSSPDLLETFRTSNIKNTPIQTNITIVDTKFAEMPLKKSAISPILSQPKIIRFPAESGFRHGTKSGKRHDGVCYWDKCNKKHESNSKLLDHMQTQHVNVQTGPFCCLWVGCKVYNRESCSRRWLERHVLSHGGSKQFKCIVDGCGLRFGSQLALQKHVNNHFSTTETKDNTNKRTSDPPVPKQLRKNGKKLRYRRQPFSARMFDFFDAGIMEALQHRLRQISTLTNSCNSITFHGSCIMRRKTFKGTFECFVRWSPGEIIADEWLPESTKPFIKTMNINQMDAIEKNRIDNLLTSPNIQPYPANSNNNIKQTNDTIDSNDYLEESNVGKLSNSKEIREDCLINGNGAYNRSPSVSGMLSVSGSMKSERNSKNTRKTQRRFLTSR